MSPRALIFAFSAVAVVLVIIVALLVTGSGPRASAFQDSLEDVSVGEGASVPRDILLADLEFARVRQSDGEVLFEARMNEVVPRRVSGQSLDWRWDIRSAGNTEWVLTANLDAGPSATIFDPDQGFGAGTLDGSFPGTISLDASTLLVTLEPSGLEDFPQHFEWSLETILDAGPGDPDSALATDRAPDSGFGAFSRSD